MEVIYIHTDTDPYSRVEGVEKMCKKSGDEEISS